MSEAQHLNYTRIAEAIQYLQENVKRQPSLDEIAEHVHLSSSHFQRLFTDWAGVSPKKFLQYLSIEHAKQILKGKEKNLFDAAEETGLSGTGRLHDLFVNIEGMTPGEYKNGGQDLSIHYRFANTRFGNVIIASTTKGICYMAFVEDEKKGLHDLKNSFPHAAYQEQEHVFQESALSFFHQDWTQLQQVKLHLKGTAFQLKVWEALLKIPMGKLSTYGAIAEEIGNPKGSRAVGTAIGSNPIAFLIPCHRVIQSTGTFGGYLWGPTRKAALIGWEAAQTE